MTEVGRVLYASTTEYAFGTHVVQARETAPPFGALVRSESARAHVYALVYDVRVNDDALVRQLVVSPDLDEEYIEDQHSNRQVPVELSTLAVGFREPPSGMQTPGAAIQRRLPPQPPMSLDRVLACNDEELRAFTERFDYFALVLSAKNTPAEDLLAAHLRLAAAARPQAERHAFLVRAGRELARLLTGDLLRLDALLRQLQE
jgi:hypothetical protein